MLGFEHAVWLKIATGTPPDQALEETMTAFQKAEELRADMWREHDRSRRRDDRIVLGFISCIVGLMAGLLVLTACLS